MKKPTLLLLCILYTCQLAFGQHIYVVDTYSVSRDQLHKGDNFELSLKLTRPVETTLDSTLTLVNTSTDNFIFSSGGTAMRLGDADPILKPVLDLTYLGNDNVFSYNIVDDSTGDVIANDSITLSEAIVKDESSGGSAGLDSASMKPNFDIVKNPFNTEFISSKRYVLTTKIKNISNYSAKNIIATLEPAEDDLPFLMSQSDLKDTVDKIRMDKNGELTFDLIFNPTVQSKQYKIKLKLTYSNYHEDVFEQEFPLYINVESVDRAPTVSILSHSLADKIISKTETSELTLDVTSSGTLNAQDINIELTGFDANGITLKNDVPKKYIGEMAPQQHAFISYNIIAMEGASGPQSLKAILTYSDGYGNQYEREEEVFLQLNQALSDNFNEVALSFSAPQYTITAGSTITIATNVSNLSDQTLSDLRLQLSENSTVTALSNYMHYIDSLKPGQTKQFSYKISVPDSVSEGIYPLEVELTRTEQESSLRKLDVTAINVLKSDASASDGKSIPKVIISNYDYGGEYALAGQAFPLTISFTNTSQSMGIKNAKVTFDSDEKRFIPVNSSNSFYMTAIGPGETVSQTVMLKTKNDIAPDLYAMHFKINYEDMEGNAYDANDQPMMSEEEITISVKQENKLSVAELNLPDYAMVGFDIPLDANFFNMGKSTMYNLLVTLEGNFDARDNTLFVGTFEPGKTEYFSCTIIPTEVGELNGKLLFSYEDASGQQETFSKAFTMTVEDNAMEEDPGMDGPGDPDNMGEFPGDDGSFGDQAGGLPSYLLYGIIVLIAILAIAGLIYWRRKKRESSLLEAADEDE